MSDMNSRIKAFLIHFLMSMTVISVFLYFVYFIWYPSPFDYFYKPFDVLKVVLSVDLVLGPLLTLVLFDIKKKISVLKKDIFIVVLIQITAFIWGVHVTYSSRPIFLIFSDDTFHMFAKNELDLSVLKRKNMLPKFWKTAAYAYLDPPKNKKELEKMYHEFEYEGKPYYRRRTERYLPLEEGFDSIIKFSINLGNVLKYEDKNKKLNKFLIDKNKSADEVVLFNAMGANKSAILVFNRSNAQLVGVMPVF